jgi:protein ImuB
MACINLPAFPLQLLVKRNPDWKDLPAAVVDKDTPQGTILWVNKRALRDRILPGMRYAKGLSLNADLRAGIVSEEEVEKQISHLIELFRFYTPDVEPSRHEAGVFWLNASGLLLLHPSLKKWAGLIGSDLSKIEFYWSITVGFSRYGVYAMAKSSKGITVFEDHEQERLRVRTVPIVRLGADPKLRDALEQLGITTLGGFMDLPSNGIRKRFGDAAYNLYKLARNELYAPLTARPPEELFVAQHSLDYPESNAERLLHLIEEHLGVIFESLEPGHSQALQSGSGALMRSRPSDRAGRSQALQCDRAGRSQALQCDRAGQGNRLLVALVITLVLDNGETNNEYLRPAAPTNDLPQVLKLIDLRLQKVSLDSGVVDFTLDAETVPASQKQLELFAKKPRRDLQSADRAFAQLRAEFGNHVIMKATLRDGHLPEASYEWEPMEKLTRPAPRKIHTRILVRRIFARPVELFSWIRSQGLALKDDRARRSLALKDDRARRSLALKDDRARQGDGRSPRFPPWSTKGEVRRFNMTAPMETWERGRAKQEQNRSAGMRKPATDVIGPYIVSGGWWMRRVHREYYYVRSRSLALQNDRARPHGRWLWVYYDRQRKQSFVQGVVE